MLYVEHIRVFHRYHCDRGHCCLLYSPRARSVDAIVDAHNFGVETVCRVVERAAVEMGNTLNIRTPVGLRYVYAVLGNSRALFPAGHCRRIFLDPAGADGSTTAIGKDGVLGGSRVLRVLFVLLFLSQQGDTHPEIAHSSLLVGRHHPAEEGEEAHIH